MQFFILIKKAIRNKSIILKTIFLERQYGIVSGTQALEKGRPVCEPSFHINIKQ